MTSNTRYDVVTCNLLTTRLRHFLGVLKSYNFFCVVRRLHGTKSHRVNRPLHMDQFDVLVVVCLSFRFYFSNTVYYKHARKNNLAGLEWICDVDALRSSCFQLLAHRNNILRKGGCSPFYQQVVLLMKMSNWVEFKMLSCLTRKWSRLLVKKALRQSRRLERTKREPRQSSETEKW